MLDRAPASATLLWLLLLLAIALGTPAVGDASDGRQTILAMLQQRVAQDPLHADSWRLLGRFHHRAGELAAARDTIERALHIDPQNAAIHFDYGHLLRDLQDPQRAKFHFRRVYELAPESGYAAQLAEQGMSAEALGLPVAVAPPVQEGSPAAAPERAGESTARAEPSAGDQPGMLAKWLRFPAPAVGDVAQASYEIKTFDGSDDVERRLHHPELDSADVPPMSRLRTFVEFGALYNSNVTLAPISRQLSNAEARSAQAFINPEFEWIGWERDATRIGGLARGYFSVNEKNLSNFDLASFQPGAFLERDQLFGWNDVTGRVDYVYSLDLFGGDRLGDRHALTTSATSLRPSGDVVHAYWTISFSQFDEDGATPALDSLDGTSNTLGISRFFMWDSLWVPTTSLGASVESADTEGANFRYDAVSLYADATLVLTERFDFVPEASVGYRGYGDFSGPEDRDELVWRAGGRLRWKWTDNLSVSAVASYDRFASDHPQYDADRTQAGLVWTLLR